MFAGLNYLERVTGVSQGLSDEAGQAIATGAAAGAVGGVTAGLMGKTLQMAGKATSRFGARNAATSVGNNRSNSSSLGGLSTNTGQSNSRMNGISSNIGNSNSQSNNQGLNNDSKTIKVLTKLRVARIVKTAILYLELITRRLIVVIIVLVLTLIIPVLQTLMMRREQVM